MAGFLKRYWIVLLIFASCSKQVVENIPDIVNLNSNWQFSQAGKNEWLSATVPGTVHADLLNHKILKDPHYRLQENDVQWIENEDWIYKTLFTISSNYLNNDVIELIFKGLDTYSDVYLNDTLILQSDNMFIGHNINIKEYLKEGDNELKIYFHSPVKKGMEKLQRLDYLIPASNEQAQENQRTSIFTRKAPFHYGWDWGPRLVTSGIWQPVYLKAWNDAIIDNVYLQTIFSNKSKARIVSKVEVNVKNSGKYNLCLFIDGNQTSSVSCEMDSGINVIETIVDINDPELWQTNGIGSQYLYNFSFKLKKEDVVIDKHELNFGIRSLRIVQETDKIGRSFYIELNGKPVFMKGANVIPPNTLTPSATKEDYLNLVKNAVDANMNMIRIWGGAIYGEDYLYELCDKYGILVWQDFMFSCAMQPGDEEHLESIAKEAEYNVKRLRNHPSLALWCGNNEIYHGWLTWGWKEMYNPELSDFLWKTYENIFFQILPKAVSKFAPNIYYHSSSPSAYGRRLADRNSGDEHDWTVWFGQRPFTAYGNEIPRFVSEFGFQSFPSMRTIESFSIEEDYCVNSPVIRHRQRGNMEYIKPGFNGNDLIKRYMDKYYDIPENFEDFVYLSQLLQALCYKTAIEFHRSAMPHCMGSLYWQLNDSWQTISWSTVDYGNRWKAAHYVVKKAFEPVIMTASVEKNLFNVNIISDKQTSFNAELLIKSFDFNGKLLFNDQISVVVKFNTSTHVYTADVSDLIGLTSQEKSFVVMELKTAGDFVAENTFFFNHYPKELVLPKNYNLNIQISPVNDGYSLEILSDKLIKNLYLDLKEGDGFFSDNYFDLLPNTTKIIKVKTENIINSQDDFIVKTLNNILR